VSGWKRCDTCRKVLAGDAFDGDATTCTACLTGPAPKVRTPRATTVTRKVAPTAPKAESGPRLGAVGSGDLEVRERRAQRSAAQQLVELHQEEFDQLLAAARRAEGLRG
jgi:hypothetical protein